MKLAKDFYCAPMGEIYPRTIPAGEACPPELVDSARALGLLEEEDKGAGDGKAGGKPGADKKAGGATGAGA
ncbi:MULTISPECIES: hypothetical protein [Methylosinus]|nr:MULTISPECIES: hypothetical protein [Methylosinus]